MKKLLFLSFALLSLLLILAGCNSKNVSVYQFEGISMEPTISDGDKFELDKNYFQENDIKTGDIVAFNMDEDTVHAKRVIGIPGELIEISDGEILVNDQPLDRSFIFNIIDPSRQVSIQLGIDEYFVIGDQPLFSKDSPTMGPITKDKIIGKVNVIEEQDK